MTGEVVELLRTLIRNECVNDGTDESGGESRSASVLRSILEVPGLEVQSFEPLPGRASLVARMPGSDPNAPTLTYLAHTDVVPAPPEGWLHDPFGADAEGGFIWGRGAVDMLNLTSSMAVAVRRLAASGFRPLGTLSFLAVADEEAGGGRGAKWLLENVPEADADYVITEWGGVAVKGPEGPRFPVMVSEKGLAWCTLSVPGTPGHGSRPYRTDNAVVKAAEVVRRLTSYDAAVKVVPAWAQYVELSGLPPALADPDSLRAALPDLDERTARLAHASTHTTISPNVVRGGQKANVIPDLVEIEVDMRTLPGQGRDEVLALLHDALGPLADEVQVSFLQQHDATESSTDTPLWRSMQEVVSALRPGGLLVPSVMTGGTDARYWRYKGSTAYGFGLFSDEISPSDYDSMFHGRNERVDIESLRLSAELWSALAHSFLS